MCYDIRNMPGYVILLGAGAQRERERERERERLDLGATMKRELRTHTPCKARDERFHPSSCHLP
jgi:hypothetical protein